MEIFETLHIWIAFKFVHLEIPIKQDEGDRCVAF